MVGMAACHALELWAWPHFGRARGLEWSCVRGGGGGNGHVSGLGVALGGHVSGTSAVALAMCHWPCVRCGLGLGRANFLVDEVGTSREEAPDTLGGHGGGKKPPEGDFAIGTVPVNQSIGEGGEERDARGRHPSVRVLLCAQRTAGVCMITADHVLGSL